MGQNESIAKNGRPKTSNKSNKVNFSVAESRNSTSRENVFGNIPQVSPSVDVVSDLFGNDEERSMDQNPSNLPLPPMEKSSPLTNLSEPKLAVIGRLEDNNLVCATGCVGDPAGNTMKIVELPDNVTSNSVDTYEAKIAPSHPGSSTVKRDIITVPSHTDGSGSLFLSAKFTADLRKYENKTESKNQNNSKKDFNVRPFQNLSLKCKPEGNSTSDVVKNKLEEIYAFKDLRPGDLDQSALDTLYKLPEKDALCILQDFSECNLNSIKNKSAYLCSIIKSRNTNESNFGLLGSKTPPPYFDSTPLEPFIYERKSPTNKITLNNKGDDLDIPEKNINSYMNSLPESSISTNYQPLGINVSNNLSPPFVNNNKSCSVNKEVNSQFNFVPCNPAAYEKPFQSRRKPLPAAKFGAKPTSYLQKTTGNRSMKPNTNSSKLFNNKHAELEKIADQLTTVKGGDLKTSSTTSEKSLFQVDSLKSSKVNPERNLTLEECIFQMENLAANKTLIRSIQPDLIYNIQNINRFLNLLKCNLHMNEKVTYELDKLKDNVSILTNINEMIPQLEPSVLPSKLETKYFLDPFCNTNENNCDMNIESFTHSSSPMISEKKIADQKLAGECKNNQGNISLNRYKSLLDDLNPNLQSQKDHIALFDDKLYCQVCEKSITSNLMNLEEHLRGKYHVQKLNEISEKSVGIGTNHLGILQLALESCKTQSPFSSFYICIPCDYRANSEEEANEHVETNHKEQNKIGDTKWHYCEYCPLHIYGLSDHYQQHCLTTQHLEIIQLKSDRNNSQELSETGSVTDGGDQRSVCSSKSDRSRHQLKTGLKTPHEILLCIAKEKKLKFNGIRVGLYCDICKKYYLNPSNLSHLKSDKHNTALAKFKKFKNITTHFCSTCNVDIFGTKHVMVEHNNIDVHKELAEERNDLFNQNRQEDESDPCDELSNQNSPHFKIMAKVLKKHLLGELKDEVIFGYYCHPCQAYSEDERQWFFHQRTASHTIRLKSFECSGKSTLHECLVCKLKMIGGEYVLELHNKTQEHQVLQKRRKSETVEENAGLGVKSEELSEGTDNSIDDEEDSEDDSSEDSNVDERSNEVLNQNSVPQDQTDNRQKPVQRNGVYVTGLPQNVSHKEVFESFKDFGFIKRSSLNPKGNSCRLIFKDEQVAARLVKLRNLKIRESKVTIHPLIDYRNSNSSKKESRKELDPLVLTVLGSKAALDSRANELQTQVVTQGLFFTQKSEQIKEDINVIFKSCKVHFFGSQVTGLALDNSDFDIYIDFDNRSFFKELPQKDQEAFIKMLNAEFTKPDSKFQVKTLVLTARVPIIRTLHLDTNTLCDISCCSGLSVENSQLVKLFVSYDARVRWLVLFVKWWMRANQLLDRTVFTSYACSWLVFYFLMKLPKPILCSVAQLRHGCPDKYSIANWDCRFTRSIPKAFKMVNKQSRYDLLTLFFKYYETFYFKSTVLCPLTGTTIPRSNFLKLQLLPPEYSPYLFKVENPLAEKLRIGTPICLQDPFDLSHNVTKGVSKIDLKRFQVLCGKSAKLCESLFEF